MGLNKRLIAPQVEEEGVVTENLIFEIDANQGSSLTDRSVYNRSMTGYNITHTSGTPSYWDFNGSSSYIETSTGASTGMKNLYTSEFWIRLDTVSTDMTWLNMYFSTQYNMRVGNSSTGTFAKDEYQPSGGGQSVGSITANTWFHIVFVRSVHNSSTGFQIYKNGSFHTNMLSENTQLANMNKYFIGQIYNGAQRLNGKISQLRIYNKALSSSEVLNNYDFTKSTYGY